VVRSREDLQVAHEVEVLLAAAPEAPAHKDL
jgi:hypothetical protein